MSHYEPELKQRVHNGKLRHHQFQKKAKVVCSAGKVMMIILFDEEGFCISTLYIKAAQLQQCTTKKSCKT